MDMPDVHYARSGDVAIAYQVIGDGPLDVVLVPDWVSNVVWHWYSPYWRAFYERMASFSRLIVFDKRGTGLSDRPRFFPDLETRMDDVRAVLEAVGSQRAALIAAQEGCWMAALFAATYPEATHSLVLFHPWLGGPDHRLGEATEEDARRVLDEWGTEEYATENLAVSPTLRADAEFRDWYVNLIRLGASPGGAYAFNRMMIETLLSSDFGDVYRAIRVPTLVLYSRYRPDARDVYARVADLIPDGRAVELPGGNYMGIFLDEPMAEIEPFLRSVPHLAESNRMLVTVLFTDLVASTERLAGLGDAAWRELVERHHEIVRRLLGRYRGREVDTAGDGYFAAFEGPARAIRCAKAICAESSGLGLEVRAGVHTGECEIIDGKPGGLGVVVGARISSVASSGEVLASNTVKDLVAGSGITFKDRGEHELKGIPGTWRLHAVVSA
jgi:class 3 adenylate cyclase/pimeloyl-ACP methyl ester carboxylesterase